MIGGLKPYPTYKDSGLPWLHNVPSQWKVRRAKDVFRCIDVRSSTGDEELLTVSAKYGVIPRRLATVTMFKAESYVGYKLCWPGDLVINSLWAWGRGLGVSRHHGIVSSAYGVYRLRPEFEDYSGFVHELVRSVPFNWELQVRSKGIWISRLQLTNEAFLEAPIPLPPDDEQAAIVRFLDHADRRIRRYIRVKKKLIALLNEQKQAIVHRAVTRGLDPSVHFKSSNVEWLGDVPHHWEVNRLKHATTPIEQGWSPQCDAQPAGAEEWGVLKVGCVNRDSFDASQNKKLPLSLPPLPDLEVRDGDVLVSRANTRELLGLAAVVEGERPRLLLCDKLFRFRPIEQLAIARFLVLAIRDKTSRAQIESSTNGASSSMQNIGQDVIRNLWLSIPSVEEQRRIVDWLVTETRPLAEAVRRAERELRLLTEYRTRLVADAVTGKIDVREAAAHLPDAPITLEDDELLAEEAAESDATEFDDAETEVLA